VDAHLPQPARLGVVSSIAAVHPVTRNRAYAIIAATILVLGLARALLVVSYSPVLGYTQPGSANSQAVGFVALAVMAAVAIYTALSMRGNPIASLVHALLFFLVVADPLAVLWLNAATPETVALVALYCAIAMLGVNRLGCGKAIHRALFVISGLIVVATVGYLTFVHTEPRPHTGVTVVPAEPGEAASPGFIADFFRELARDIPASASIAPPTLDISGAGTSMRTIADLPPHIMSFTALLSHINVVAWMMIAMSMILTLPFAVAAVWWARRRAGSSTPAIPAVYAALIAVTAYIAIAAALGTGDAARMLSIGWLAMLAAIVMLPLLAWHLSQDSWTGPIALVCLVGIVLVAGSWVAWTRKQPIAIGAVERIAESQQRTLEVTGWALDPRGVKRVFATVGGGAETTAVLGTERRDLQGAYPGYPDAVTSGFQMSIPSNAWRGNQRLSVYVENRTGAVTEIDHRDVKAATP
jgi:hypothetical protein